MPHENPFMDSELDSESEVSSSDSSDSFEVISDFDVEDQDSADSDDFKESGLHEKYLGVENYSLNDERMYIRNGKLHITNNEADVRIYEKLTDKDLLIDKDINGTWKVTSMENFEEFKKYRNLRKKQEFLWQYGHAFYKLETDQLTRGTVINGVQKDLSLVTLNVSIEDASTSKVTFLEGDKLITVCKWMGSGLEKWRIERFFKEGKLHVVHGYPNGIICTRVLERV